MFFWNRVEIYCGFSIKDFSELRNALAAQKIRYDYKIVNNAPKSDRIMFSIGSNPNYQNMYYLYVHKKDYDRAMFHTSNRSN